MIDTGWQLMQKINYKFARHELPDHHHHHDSCLAMVVGAQRGSFIILSLLQVGKKKMMMLMVMMMMMVMMMSRRMFLTVIFSVMMIGEVRLSMGLPNHEAARMEEAAEEREGGLSQLDDHHRFYMGERGDWGVSCTTRLLL